MLFTRTIRRTMLCGVALILVMLITLSLSGISGLMEYRALVNELEFSMKDVPRRSDLAQEIGQLFEALLLPISPKHKKTAASHQAEFARSLVTTRASVRAFYQKLDKLPNRQGVSNLRMAYESHLRKAYDTFDELERLQIGLGNESTRNETAQQMTELVIRLQVDGSKLPDFQDRLDQSYRKAKRVYHSRFWLIFWTTTLVVVLFLGLVRYAYAGIFAPLRKLHQGACRVAQGDFDYRVELVAQDEMAELAESFNKMTARFQEVASDLDNQVRARGKQLVQSERLASVGVLAAGVAHEINNPLSAIVMASDSLLANYGETDEQGGLKQEDLDVSHRYLKMMQREAFRCQEITTKLLDFSRGHDTSRSQNDLTAIISEVLSMVQHLSKFRDRKVEFLAEKPCYLEINGPEIKQVILNLVANALESMERGGALRIDLVEMTDSVLVKFVDNGCGMTAEVIEHLFDPFFTRRKDGKGTGLGMSISHRIISDHGGTIEASSDGPTCGSTFVVQLPRTPADSELAA